MQKEQATTDWQQETTKALDRLHSNGIKKPSHTKGKKPSKRETSADTPQKVTERQRKAMTQYEQNKKAIEQQYDGNWVVLDVDTGHVLGSGTTFNKAMVAFAASNNSTADVWCLKAGDPTYKPKHTHRMKSAVNYPDSDDEGNMCLNCTDSGDPVLSFPGLQIASNKNGPFHNLTAETIVDTEVNI